MYEGGIIDRVQNYMTITCRLYLTETFKQCAWYIPENTIQLRFLHFLFPLTTSVSSCLFFVCFLFYLFWCGLTRHVVAGNLIFISKQFLQRGNGFFPTISGRVKSSTFLQYFFPSIKQNTPSLLQVFHLSSQQKGCNSFAQRCCHNSTSAVRRSLLLSPHSHIHIHSLSIDQVCMLDAR